MSADLARWIGLPYADKGRGPDAYDCWGLVRVVFLEERRLALPDYRDAYEAAKDHDSVAAAVRGGLADGWRAVDRPRAFDLVILNIAARPWHCGVMVAADRFLHVMPPAPGGAQAFSCIERIDSPRWQRRVEGFYRHD